MRITNESIADVAVTVMTNDHRKLQTSVPMAGRSGAAETLRRIVTTPGPSVVTLSAPLGAGKTFFLDTVFGEMYRELAFPVDDNRYRVQATEEEIPPADHPERRVVERVREALGGASPEHPRVLVIEELDRKGDYEVLLWTVAQGLEWLADAGDATLILTGDGFIFHPEVVEALRTSGLPATTIDLEPLDEDLMCDALALRFQQAILRQNPAREPDEEGLAAARAVLRHRPVATAVVPPSDPAAANFREAFGLLRLWTDNIERAVPGIEFPASLIDLTAEDPPLFDVPAQRVDQWLIARVREELASSRPMTPITIEELRQAEGSDLDDEDLFDEVIWPMNNAQMLVPLGIPFLGPDGPDPELDMPAPFLP
ncbi:MAG TPA: hypothetical protein VGO60_08400, partial [Iamia sp.]|nr:hypothetical protein [Iamia sp.]